jgi:ribosomal protein S18 acetylase RimI-like enzyme
MNRHMETEIHMIKSASDIAKTADLAQEIWNEHYVDIIGQAQVDYMLSEMQSQAAITEEIQSGSEYYLASVGETAEGYLAVTPDPGGKAAMLSKIYTRKEVRGQGIGQTMLEFAETLCRERGFTTIWLTVNKHNSGSIGWYESRGFVKVDSLVTDIGNRFVMDDFKLKKVLTW